MEICFFNHYYNLPNNPERSPQVGSERMNPLAHFNPHISFPLSLVTVTPAELKIPKIHPSLKTSQPSISFPKPSFQPNKESRWKKTPNNANMSTPPSPNHPERTHTPYGQILITLAVILTCTLLIAKHARDLKKLQLQQEQDGRRAAAWEQRPIVHRARVSSSPPPAYKEHESRDLGHMFPEVEEYVGEAPPAYEELET